MTKILDWLIHLTLAEALSIVKNVSGCSVKSSVISKIEACVLKPVVAPQPRLNRTIFLVLSGDISSPLISLAQSGSRQLGSENKSREIRINRIIFRLTYKHSHPLREGDLCYWVKGSSCHKAYLKKRRSGLATAACSPFLLVSFDCFSRLFF